ncbi:hypothetical protein NHH03_12130 [Stieleria sp. TO1_6]|uniref:hypothetical protein n=1 Tax=Stieleria tagensis TaxID=2956795 RepID=UPI00209B8317|nr:hypothetical protein [Stieleria tagensis]MCO8122487.1 hypothetical protein [Stieleria tagensis]
MPSSSQPTDQINDHVDDPDVADSVSRHDDSVESREPIRGQAVSAFHAKKLKERREEWQINGRLVAITCVVLVAVLGLGAASYFYHSSSAIETFRARANDAAAAGDAKEQVRWWSRYLMMAPGDPDAIMAVAHAADQVAEEASAAGSYPAINDARRRLSQSLAELGQGHEQEQSDLRRRLIRRLLQLGGAWYREAEQQVVALAAPDDDRFASKALALALYGQVQSGIYDDRSAVIVGETDGFWGWLAQQPPGVVLNRAVQLSPDDLELDSEFLTLARSNPTLFVRADDKRSRSTSELYNQILDRLTDWTQQVGVVLKRLRADDSGRSILIQYAYGAADKDPVQRQQAQRFLLQSAPLAQQRLRTDSADAKDDEQESATVQIDAGSMDAESSADQITASELSLYQGLSPEFWDYQCLLEAARISVAQILGQAGGNVVAQNGSETAATKGSDGSLPQVSPAQTEQWFQTLIAASVPDVRPGMRENTYLYAGSAADAAGDLDRAVEIWRQGLKEVSTDSLELRGAVAGRLAATAKTDSELATAKKELDLFDVAIQAESRRLLEATSGEFSEGQRNQFGRAIELARWRASVARARLLTSEGGGAQVKGEVIALLQSALNSNADVRPVERAQLAITLAGIYQELGVWDQSANALSVATELLPGDESLHAAAAEAWSRAGHQVRAAEEWRLAANSTSLPTRIRAIEAEFNNQLSGQPAMRDLSGLRSRITALRSKLDNPSDPDTQKIQDETLADLRARLQIVELMLPSAGELLEQHLKSPELAESADELANANPSSAVLQAYAAERLAVAGLAEKSERRLAVLKSIQGEDSTNYAIAQARVDALLGQPLESAKRLAELAKNNVDDAAQLSRLAANYALGGSDSQLAYDVLKHIPKVDRSPQDLYQLYRLANLSEDNLQQEAKTWFDDLKKLEGDQGTFWRYIEIENSIDELAKDSDKLERDDPRIARVRASIDQLTAMRPRWGQAITLRARLLDLSGQHERALEQVRTGIAAGDSSIAARQLLLRQLVALDRQLEAEEELKRLAMSTSSVVDAYSQNEIQSAFRRGDLMLGVEAARKSAQASPDDLTAQLVFARVASQAVLLDQQSSSSSKSRATLTPNARRELIDEARQTVENAERLAQENEFALAAIRLELELRHGSPESVDAELQRLESSQVEKYQQLLLRAEVQRSRGEIDQAIQDLQESNRLHPAVDTQLRLARLYQSRGESKGLVQSLQDALKLRPGDSVIRNDLARALLVHQGDTVQWDQIEALLSSGAEVTPANRLMYATMLAAKGSEEQQLTAMEMLREIVAEKNAESNDASVVLAALFIKLSDQYAKEGRFAEKQESYLSEAREIYQRLARARPPRENDLYRYGVFLLQHGTEKDLAVVKTLSEDLAVMPGGMLQSLELGLIDHQRRGNSDETPEWVSNWVEAAKTTQDRRQLGAVETAAGSALMKLGFTQQALEWFDKAYQANSDSLTNYVVALSNAGEHRRAAELCADHFDQNGDARSAMLLVESLLAEGSGEVDPRYSKMLKRATADYPRDAALLESVATWAMQRGRTRDAISLYRQVLAMDSLRVRTLNNLAMAYAQIPELAAEGIEPIDRAIKLTKRNPELLDTKGAVLMSARRYREAIDVFDEAIAIIPDPRYKFHKILALLALKQTSDAHQLWQSIEADELDVNGLTEEERELFNRMKQDFDSVAKDLT